MEEASATKSAESKKSNGGTPPTVPLDHKKTLEDVASALGCSPELTLDAVNLLKDMLVDASKLVECVNEPCGCAMSSVARAMKDAAEGKLPDGGLDEWQTFLKSTEPCDQFKPRSNTTLKDKKTALKKKVAKRKQQEASSSWSSASSNVVAAAKAIMQTVRSKQVGASVVSSGGTKKMASCEWCGTRFYNRTGKMRFDTKSCAAKARPSKKKLSNRSCATCGNMFKPINSADMHCCPACRTAAVKMSATSQHGAVTKTAVRKFEYVRGTSNKFWEYQVVGLDMVVTYGKNGTSGTTTMKSFSSRLAALNHARKVVSQKITKGYTDVTFHKSDTNECNYCGAGYELSAGYDDKFCSKTCFDDF